ncbi:MAG: tyrosine recombinase XerD [Acidimicrobiia bacterium]|nr:tyrosine recombinase XerD [Acidimicrobiia bacterium]
MPAEEFLTWLGVERGRAASTIAAYRRDLRAYMGHLTERGVDLASATIDDITDFVSSMNDAGLAPATSARRLVAVRTLHRFLVDEEAVEHDPVADLEAPSVPRGIPKALTEDEVSRLLSAVVGDSPVARRDRAILEVLYGTGARISELTGLSLSDIDLVAARMRVFGKGSKERVVPIGRHAGLALEAWLDEAGRTAMAPRQWRRRGDAEAVFINARGGGRLTRQGAWGVVRKHGDAAGLADRLTPHVLRHSCATHMVDHGADLRVVQELLGHASVSTTQVYTLVSTERLWAVYDNAHPRARAATARPLRR